MAFNREPTKTPTRISRITLHVAVKKSLTSVVSYDNGTAEISVVLSDDSEITKTVGNLNAELTTAQRNSIKAIVDNLLLRAETEIL